MSKIELSRKIAEGYRLIRIDGALHLISPANNGGDNINADRGR